MRGSARTSLLNLAAGVSLFLVAACRQAEISGEEAPPAAEWQPLFDGRSLGGWKRAELGGREEPRVEDGWLIIPRGAPMAGIVWTREFPADDYEIALEAMRLDGRDFFCGLTFPVGGSAASLILGGWGGGLCGISSLDGLDASENETLHIQSFENGRWYAVRLRVAAGLIEAWLDGEQIVDLDTAGRKVHVRSEIAPCRPLGFASYDTVAALREIRWRLSGTEKRVGD
jgi:hypothetical protein